jgi:hypothetical protein
MQFSFGTWKLTILGIVFSTGISVTELCYAQAIDSNTVVIPHPVFSDVDENGVNTSSNSLSIPGPYVSIGDPKNGGLMIQPFIVGPDAIPLGSCAGPNCNAGGFTNGLTNMSASLVVNGLIPYAKMPRNSIPLAVYTSGGVARFYETSMVPGTITEFSPQIGRTLTYSSGTPKVTQLDTGERMTFQDSDGTKYVFFYISDVNKLDGWSYSSPVQSIVRPNGEVITFSYNSALKWGGSKDTIDFRLSSISNNRGYMLKFQEGSFVMNSPQKTVRGETSVVAVNLAKDQCSITALVCNLNDIWPMMTGGRLVDEVAYPTAPRTYVDAEGATTSVNVTWPSTPISGPVSLNATLTRPNGRTVSFTYDYTKNIRSPVSIVVNCPQAPNQVSPNSSSWRGLWTFPCPYAPIKNIKSGSSSWAYDLAFNFSPNADAPTGNYYVSGVISTRTNPDGAARVVTALPSGQITSVKDELGRTTIIDVLPTFDPNEGRIKKITYPGGNGTSFFYDARGNVTQEIKIASSGSPLQSLTTINTYPISCENWKICNKPTSRIDSNGGVTTYSWDPDSGQILSQALPADLNGISSVTRYAYSQMYAWVSNGAGGSQQAGAPIWMLTQTRTCRTKATIAGACAGDASDEKVVDYYYGPPSAPNNLELRGMSVTANGTKLTTCYAYDKLGRQVSVTKPNANLVVCP